MPLAYVLDENLRGLLWRHIRRHNLRSDFPIDVVRVGDVANRPRGSIDSMILLWAEIQKRILISRDEKTLPKHLTAHLEAGHHSPGIFLAREVPLAEIVDFLVCASYASDASEWEDRWTFIP